MRSDVIDLRGLLFLASILVIWISVDGFVDLRANTSADEAGNFLNQVTLMGTAIVCGCFLLAQQLHHRFREYATPGLILLIGWLAISAITSFNPELSFRRLLQTLCVVMIAAAALHLPRTVAHFNRLIFLAVVLVLAVAYCGVFFLPDLSIHSADDLVQPEHAGNWRGHFPHKNRAGGAMAVLVFLGLYLAAAYDRWRGLSIVAAASIFLFFTASSTALALLLAVLPLSGFLSRIRSGGLRIFVATWILGFVAIFTIGTVIFEPVRVIVETVAIDPTYTNRTALWEYGLSHLQIHPFIGFGYEAFWGLGGAGYSDEIRDWVRSAPNGHNAYLDVALSAGLPGLFLFMLWLVIRPLRDFHQARATGTEPRLSMFFLRVWLFGILYACLETSLLFGKDPVGFMVLISVFGLRLLAAPRLAPAHASTSARNTHAHASLLAHR